LNKGLKFTFSCNEACKGSMSGTIDAKTAKKVHLLKKKSKAKTFKVCSAKIPLKAGKRTIACKFTKKAAKALKRQKKVKFTITASVSDAAGNGVKLKGAFTVKK
jgi:hypothetical protein